MKFPKLTFLGIGYILIYLVYALGYFDAIHQLARFSEYIQAFIAGLFYSYGFTSGIAVVLLVALSDNLPRVTIAIIAGLGALVSDLLIFNFIRHSFMDEIKLLSKTKYAQALFSAMPYLLKKYLSPLLAIIVIASPLPDELGVSLFAGLTKISKGKFIFISFILNSLGILTILLFS